MGEKLGDEFVWSWALEVLRIYLDLPPDAIRRKQKDRLALGGIEIPVVEAPANQKDAAYLHDYEMNIRYAGREGTFQYIPAHRLIDGDIPDGYFTGKIVLYGGTAAGLW